MKASTHGGFTAPDHLLCIDELGKRREIAIQLESYIELNVSGFRLCAEDVSTILMAPIEHFESGQVFSVHRFQRNGVTYYPPLAYYMKRHLEGIAPLCKHYLVHRGKENRIDPTPGQCVTKISKPSPELQDHVPAKSETSESDSESDPDMTFTWDTPIFRTNLKLDDHVRDREEEAKCLERDGKACVVLGTENPRVSHIIPYTWNDTKEHNNTTGDIKMRAPGLFRLNINGAASYVCNPHELGGTDKVWNMMCLHPELHKLWAKGYCAFKHICTEHCDEDKSKVTLQFRWMPQIKKRLGQEIDVRGTGPGSDWQQRIEELNAFHSQGNPPPAPCQEALRHLTVFGDPLLSGQLIHIHMPTDDTKRFGEVIDIQWACILFTALVGAAGNPELLSMNSGDKAMQWIQSQARWADEHEHESD
ncbi:hypothetical protein FPANT_1128 [Fusarium pseudoanthophilum]|uniref:HNH nuclease domain-containing protein n=1 Tax=Fusarium pseudoanthophilum TaxID=48495 RepID=A0A8H5PY11_9HYPO|nr:hypothetical protein FPANT_1128 [Fusarium pseudoanthophilum]